MFCLTWAIWEALFLPEAVANQINTMSFEQFFEAYTLPVRL